MFGDFLETELFLFHHFIHQFIANSHANKSRPTLHVQKKYPSVEIKCENVRSDYVPENQAVNQVLKGLDQSSVRKLQTCGKPATSLSPKQYNELNASSFRQMQNLL